MTTPPPAPGRRGSVLVARLLRADSVLKVLPLKARAATTLNGTQACCATEGFHHRMILTTASSQHRAVGQRHWPRGKLLGGSSHQRDDLHPRCGPTTTSGRSSPATRPGPTSTCCRCSAAGGQRPRRRRATTASAGRCASSDLRWPHRGRAAVIAVRAAHAGYARNDDFNGATPGRRRSYQVTQRNGRRCSATDAYLHPAHGRPNLHRPHRCPGHPGDRRGRPGDRRGVPATAEPQHRAGPTPRSSCPAARSTPRSC